MAWTEAQQKVIDTRSKNILVSAAAGSGKTAVLVERIITMISEGENPQDIDHLLVVTFTNAAAAEMRSRIGEAIDKKLLEQPGNLHLQKQLSLLQSAQITTIHSFCLNVIRNYFQNIDLDPSFKIAEESEITLMKSDVISELLERWYEEGGEDFHAFIESYSYSKSDAPIEELILQLYNFSMSAPWPQSWLEEKRKMFDLSSVEDMVKAPWINEMFNYIKAVLGDLLSKNEQAIHICNEPDGPAAYAPALLSDRNLLEILTKAASYEEYAQLFAGIGFERLSGKKQEGVPEWKKVKVKTLRDEVKKGIKDIEGQFFFQSPEEMLKDLQAVDGVMEVLFNLTLEFMEEFAKKKEEKNLIDFNDLEHFALRILVEEAKTDKIGGACPNVGETSSMYVPTLAALELSEQYDEILIDEYQDSNMVQETILKSISREKEGMPNRFMVGDVKQSIYKFRLAMPEIFMEKYEDYSVEADLEDGQINLYQRIDLDRNFRSRKTVLYYVNQVFEQIMQKSVGGIIYNEAAALKYGELFEETLQEGNAKAGLSEETLQKGNTVAEVSEKTLQEGNAVAGVSDETLQEGNAVAGVSDETLQEGNAVTGLSEESLHKEDTPTWLAEEVGKRIATEVELLLVTEEGLISEASEKEDNENTATALDRSNQEETPDEAIYTKREIEARAIARKIKELTDPLNGMLVFDRKLKGHRPARYSDIVILLRSMTGWSEAFVNTLMQEGIPAYAETATGYFQTLEIMTILNMLRIIDNPRQDIPLTGVLYSQMVGITSTELALIRASARNVSMYSALLKYAEEGSNEALHDKVLRFTAMLKGFRSMVNHKPIHELIQTVLDQTGYYYYISAMPGGEQRKANMDMLVAQAVRFEKGSYSGLFHFIRYIEKLNKYEVDFGEASTSGEQDNTVRIMSIHKSKGLEFPVVFVAGMSKQFNTQDIRSSIVLHNELGVGPEYIDSKRRTKVPTLLKKVIQKKVQIENIGEELRVLYVAMTRAKEKLILTGFLKSLEEITTKEFSFYALMSAKSYMDWVLPATLNRLNMKPEDENKELVYKEKGIRVTVIPQEKLLAQEVVRQIFLNKDKEDLYELNTEEVHNQSAKEEIKRRFNYLYPYQKEAGFKVKMTVSELKKLGQYEQEEQSIDLLKNQERITGTPQSVTEPVVTVPAFISQKETVILGTDRGTLYHKVLELLDLRRVNGNEDVVAELERLVQEGFVKSTDIEKLKLDYIKHFADSSVSKRMRKAEIDHKLYKEKQFVMGIRAAEVVPGSDSKELILIQGIIDVFFEEAGELVLLDYKSDLVKEEEQLVKRYKVQLEYYRKALEQITKKRVKEMIIYSLPLGKEIRIDIE